MKLVLIILAVAASIFAMSHSAHGQTDGSIIWSETVIYTFSNSTQLGEASFEAKISSNSSLVVQTVLVETNSSAMPSVSIIERRVYGPSGESFSYNSPAATLPTGSDGEVRAVAGVDVLPLGAPEGGGLGLILEASGLQQGDQLRVTFVYIANAGSAVSAELAPATQFPLFVVENSQVEITGNASSLKISDSFVNPEIHCEICTAVERVDTGQASVAYTANATDLTDATTFVFWVMGASGGESVTFNVAGKGGNATAYANSTSVALGSEWKMYEIDLAGADLTNITHLFGFEVSGGQAFYVKGAAYNQ